MNIDPAEYTHFKFEDLFINENSGREPYRRRRGEIKTVITWADRTLLLQDIEFLSLYWDPQEIPNPTCVYLVGVVTEYLQIIVNMFPTFTFHFYGDPNLPESERVIVHDKDITTFDQFKNQDVFLISHLMSSGLYSDFLKKIAIERGIDKFDHHGKPVGHHMKIKSITAQADKLFAEHNLVDLNTQKEFVDLINPVQASLRFRLGYPTDDDEEFEYFRGSLFFELWGMPSTSDTMLVPFKENGEFKMGQWNLREYEEWNFHQNVRIRDFTTYINPLTNDYTIIDKPELVNDYESTAEVYILKRYFQKFDPDVPPAKLNTDVINLSKVITWTLNGRQETPDLTDRRTAIQNKIKTDPFRSKPRVKINK